MRTVSPQSMVPLSGKSLPAIKFSRVDLPAPLRPTMPTRSSLATP